MQNENHFDYLIIGNGLAGLQLALSFSEDSFFDSYKIALIDPSDKSTNDKTWSFWEQGTGKWDAIVEQTWNTALFKSDAVSFSLNLEPYLYKSIRSLDLYSWAKEKLSIKPNIKFIIDRVETIDDSNGLKIIGSQNNYSAKHVFDSRIPKEFFTLPSKQTHIHQHFKGFFIASEESVFNPESFTMMDYRYQYKDSTSFIYLLPFSETKALVEFTFFTPFIVKEPIYDEAIKSYLEKELNLTQYQIIETEIGNIPMTDFPFWNYNTPRITKIGTGGGWVKGSTGYSFKHTEKKVAKLIQNIKTGKNPADQLFQNKFKFYDKIFLKVLKNENEKGPWIFERFYSKNSIATMFRFLDEETTFAEDLKIMRSLFSYSFIKEFFNVLFRR